ncbi:hypothetical protein D3C85_1714800 [compost metagenome]
MVGQPIGGVGEHLGRLVEQWHIFELAAWHRVARGDRIGQLRELHGAVWTASGFECSQLVDAAVLLGQRGLDVLLGAHAPFQIDAVAVGKET